ncbi:MAG: alpha/beta fold hydrolase, partial [Planctomycetaceae bacterium]
MVAKPRRYCIAKPCTRHRGIAQNIVNYMADSHQNFTPPLACELSADRAQRRLDLDLSDGMRTSVYYHAATRAQTPAADIAVVYCHGIQSHPGWFCASADYLAGAGYPVYQITRRGSGDVPMARGDTPSARQLLDDLDAACNMAISHSNAGRLALVGVSWGGKLLAAYLASRRPANIASLTLVAPGIVPLVDVPAATKLKIAAARLFQPARLFDIPLNDVELFTANPPMQQYLRSDPCRLHQATARLLFASKQLDIKIALCPRGAISAPTTLILAGEDQIIDNAATTKVVNRLTNSHATVITLPGRHTLEFEPQPQTYFAALLTAV